MSKLLFYFSKLLLFVIAIYRRFVSPILVLIFGNYIGCRFYPSCSVYTRDAIVRYGVVRGFYFGFLRILRCNPLCAGGVDLP